MLGDWVRDPTLDVDKEFLRPIVSDVVHIPQSAIDVREKHESIAQDLTDFCFTRISDGDSR